jgi:molybdenum cofactor biosynthesis protein B
VAHAHVAPHTAIRVHVVTCSDTRTLETDSSGQLAERLLTEAGHVVTGRHVVPDEPALILACLQGPVLAADPQVVILNGGTGISRRDRTFDVVARLLDKRIDGFGELFRVLSWEQVGAAAMLSRATAGLWGERVLFSVPGSTNAVRLAMERLILPELVHVVREAAR